MILHAVERNKDRSFYRVSRCATLLFLETGGRGGEGNGKRSYIFGLTTSWVLSYVGKHSGFVCVVALIAAPFLPPLYGMRTLHL